MAGSDDVFVTAIGPGGTNLVFSTYLGGTRSDEALSVALDPAGAAYVTPAQMAHFVWAREGAVEYQEMGKGPTGTVFLPAESAR